MIRFVFQKDHSGRFTKMYTGGEAGPDPDHYRNIRNKYPQYIAFGYI